MTRSERLARWRRAGWASRMSSRIGGARRRPNTPTCRSAGPDAGLWPDCEPGSVEVSSPLILWSAGVLSELNSIRDVWRRLPGEVHVRKLPGGWSGAEDRFWAYCESLDCIPLRYKSSSPNYDQPEELISLANLRCVALCCDRIASSCDFHLCKPCSSQALAVSVLCSRLKVCDATDPCPA